MGQQAGDRSREAKGLEYLGLTYTFLGDYDSAITSYEYALQLREATGNLPRVALTLTMLSYVLTQRGRREDLNQAINYYLRSYKIDEEIENWQALARYWGDVAVTYNKLGDIKKLSRIQNWLLIEMRD